LLAVQTPQGYHRELVLQKEKFAAQIRSASTIGRCAEINRLLLHENVAGMVTNKKRKLSHNN